MRTKRDKIFDNKFDETEYETQSITFKVEATYNNEEDMDDSIHSAMLFEKIEELINELKKEYTIAIVTHNMQQAARVSDFTAFMYLGELVEYGKTDEIFIKPKKKETEDYITGRFG